MTTDFDDPENAKISGYKNPPIGTRFVKGQSGNPGGRPTKRADAPSDRLIALLEEKLQSGCTMLEALWKALLKRAAHGDTKAARLILDEYRDAKRGQRSKMVDDQGDREFIERTLGLDHPLVKELSDEAAGGSGE